MKIIQFLVIITFVLLGETAHAGTAAYYIYDEQGHLIGEYNADGSTVQEHVYVGDRPVAVVQNGTADYVSTDQLNTPRVITDSSQNVVWSWNSDPFGNGQPVGSLTYNLRFPGQYYDAETGHNYNYNRDYDPATGRYVESDPIGLAGGINTYAYVLDNPLGNTDPFGTAVLNPNHFPVSPDVLAALQSFNQMIGCDKNVVITGGNRPSNANYGAPNSPHKHNLAADIFVQGQSNLVVANEADASGLFGGIGWYEEGYNPGVAGEGPHVHVDLRQLDPADYGAATPARWGYDKNGNAYHGYFPAVQVSLSHSQCGCGN